MSFVFVLSSVPSGVILQELFINIKICQVLIAVPLLMFVGKLQIPVVETLTFCEALHSPSTSESGVRNDLLQSMQ